MKNIIYFGLALGLILLYAYAGPVNYGGNCYHLVVLSGSMEPELPVGSLIFAKTVNPDDIQTNDVIVFQQNMSSESKIFVTHRVIDIIDGKFQTKGDANEDVDTTLVEPSDVKAKQVLVIPQLGYLISSYSKLMRTPAVFIPVFAVPAVVLIISEIRRIWIVSEAEKIMNESKRRYEMK